MCTKSTVHGAPEMNVCTAPKERRKDGILLHLLSTKTKNTLLFPSYVNLLFSNGQNADGILNVVLYLVDVFSVKNINIEALVSIEK